LRLVPIAYKNVFCDVRTNATTLYNRLCTYAQNESHDTRLKRSKGSRRTKKYTYSSVTSTTISDCLSVRILQKFDLQTDRTINAVTCWSSAIRETYRPFKLKITHNFRCPISYYTIGQVKRCFGFKSCVFHWRSKI
jgi:hypothetical protein